MTAGYGKMLVDGKLRQATHVAFFLKYGHWPTSRLLRHTCDIKRCVLDEHLLEGSHKDNHDDMKSRGRSARGEKHGMVKLTQEQIAAIRAAEGENKHIAYWYGVTGSQIGRIRSGKSWGWLAASAS